MKKIFNVKILLILLFTIAICFFVSNHVEAASADITVNSTAEVNKPVTISVSVTGVQWNLKLIVDGTVIAQSSELENYTSNKSISFSGTYTPTTQGNKTVQLEGSVTEFSDGSTITSFGTKTINVIPAATPTPTPEVTPTPTTNQSTPAPTIEPTPTATPAPVQGKYYLYITPSEYDTFKFDKNTKKYEVKVPNEITSIGIYLGGAEVKSSSGTGTKNLEVGNTSCKISVTEIDGTQRDFEIVVTRSTEPTETVPNVVEEPEELLKLSSLEVKNATLLPEFNPDVYEYEVELTDGNIQKLDILATANIENASIDVTGNENFMEGENTVSIVLKSEDGTKAATYTITVTKGTTNIEGETVEPIDEEEQEPVEEEKKSAFSFLKSGNTGMIVILVIAVIVLLASIITVVIILIKNRKDSEAEMMSFTPSSEYNVFEEKSEDKVEKIESEEKPNREKRRGKHF